MSEENDTEEEDDEPKPEAPLPGGIPSLKLKQGKGLQYMPNVKTIDEIVGSGGGDSAALSTTPKAPAPVSALEYGEAGAAGLARGVTLGLSDPLLTGTGVTTPAKLAELQQKAPLTSTLTELAGNIAPIALTEGAAAPEVAGEVAARSIGKEAAKQALIGAALGGGQKISENTIADKESLAEGILPSMIEGGLLGGGTGALVGAISHGAQPMLDKIGQKTGQLGETLQGLAKTQENSAMERAIADQYVPTNAPGSDLVGSVQFIPSADRKVLKESLERGVTNLTQNMQDVADVQAESGKIFHGAGQSGLRYQEQAELTKGLDSAKIKDAASSMLDDVAGAAPSTTEIPSNEDALQQVLEARDEGGKRFKTEEPLNKKGDVENAPDTSILGKMKANRLIEPRVKDQTDYILSGLREDLEDKDAPSEIMSSIRDTKRKLQDLENSLGGTTDVGKNAALGYLKDIQGAIKDHLEDPEIYGAAGTRENEINQVLAKEMDANQGILDSGLGKKVITKGQPGFDIEINPKAVRSLAKDLVAGKMEAQTKLGAITDWMDSIKAKGEQISKSSSSVPTSETAGELKTILLQQAKQMAEVQGNTERVQQLQEALQNALPATGIIQGLLSRHLGDRLAEAVTHPVETVQTLAKMISSSNRITNKINRGVSAFMGSNIARDVIPIAASHTLEGTSWSGKRQNSKEDRQSGYMARRKELLALSTNPEALTNQISQRTGKIHDAAPVTSGIVAMKAAQAVQHLASKLNPASGSPDLIQPNTKGPGPSNVEMDKLETAHRVVKDPTSVLASMRAGALTSDEVDTLKTVYPKLYQQMSTAMITKLSNTKEPVPYANRLQISTFLGQPADASLLPQNFAMLQSNFANDQTQEQPPMLSGKKRQNSSKVADMETHAETPFQKAVNA